MFLQTSFHIRTFDDNLSNFQSHPGLDGVLYYFLHAHCSSFVCSKTLQLRICWTSLHEYKVNRHKSHCAVWKLYQTSPISYFSKFVVVKKKKRAKLGFPRFFKYPFLSLALSCFVMLSPLDWFIPYSVYFFVVNAEEITVSWKEIRNFFVMTEKKHACIPDLHRTFT